MLTDECPLMGCRVKATGCENDFANSDNNIAFGTSDENRFPINAKNTNVGLGWTSNFCVMCAYGDEDLTVQKKISREIEVTQTGKNCQGIMTNIGSRDTEQVKEVPYSSSSDKVVTDRTWESYFTHSDETSCPITSCKMYEKITVNAVETCDLGES